MNFGSQLYVKLDKIKQFPQRIIDSARWIYSPEYADALRKIMESIGPFIAEEPIGFLFPLLIECTDIAIRRRFIEHVPDLIHQLDQKKPQLNREYMHSPDGQKLLKNVLRNMIQETNEEKIKYLKQFLVTGYTRKDTDLELTNMFFKILIDMEPIHIKLLGVLKNPREIIFNVADTRRETPRPENDRPYGKDDCVVCWSEDKYDDLNQFYLQSDLTVYSNAHNDLVIWNILKAKIVKFFIHFHPDIVKSKSS